MPRFPALYAIAVLIGTLFIFVNAQAHSLHVFAMGNGDVIDGYAYFGGGARPHDAEIQLLDDTGRVIFAGKTDDQGEFKLRVSHRQDYVIEANSGDGHIASFKINGDELSVQLPSGSEDINIYVSQIDTASSFQSGPPPSSSTTVATATSDAMVTLSRDELDNLIDAAVSRHVRPLREQLVAYEDKVRFSDLLGGIGVIIGIFGAFAWFRAGQSRPDQQNEKT
ncbi:hypothetical protein [Thalassospira sp. MCCC 1A03138]|uniref:hypothetical protein n=1 Tax=Thalassospira sp. MCCC 1A03138 TaxID=1470576 RepID=UPI000A1FC148|nr:hypothetical protein [Thalassospira sp. MCCC 1A03138]